MRFRSFYTFFEYLNGWFKYSRATTDVVYRLVKVKQSAEGDCSLVISVVGESTFLEFTPEALAADDQMLEGFSRRDVRTIIYFACEQLHRPKFKIRFQEFCSQLNRMIFRLHQFGSRETINKTAGEIILDEKLINSLSQKDVQSISYTAGYEHSLLNHLPDQNVETACVNERSDEIIK